MTKSCLFLTVLSFCAVGSFASAQNVIKTASDTFTPSFRDATNQDLNNTTYFGWSSGSFDGGTNNELMENPAPTLGVGGLDGSLNQDGTADILSSVNDIYIGSNGRSDNLSLTITTNGVVGLDGFTTIIIQGLTILGGPEGNILVNTPVFGSINGVAPEIVMGTNSNSNPWQGQWWVKYQLTGNQAIYDLDIAVANVGGNTLPLTISKLTVDTQYSTTGFAPDTAQAVPEPSTYALMALGLGLVAWKAGRRVIKQA